MHGAAAACVTVCVSPPAVIVAVRCEPVFADAEYAIVPLAPVPVAPDVIDSHDALELALQEHDASLIVIDTLPVPPDAGTLAVDGDNAVTVHGVPPQDQLAMRLAATPPAVVNLPPT